MNKIFSFGNNFDGCLLTNNNNDTEFPIENLIINNFDNIYLGIRNIAFFNSNSIYLYGRLYEDESYEEIHLNNNPSIINSSIKIVNISLGMYHFLILDEYGSVYSKGKGINGELGLGKKTIFTKEIKRIIIDVKIKKIFSSIKQSYAININNDVFVWGYNKNYELGIGNLNHDNEFYSNNCYYLPQKLLIEDNIIDIKSGLRHVIYISEEKLYFCGDNKKKLIPYFNNKENIIMMEEVNLKILISKILDEENLKIKKFKLVDILSGWNNLYFHIDFIYSNCNFLNNEEYNKSFIICLGDNNLNQLCSVNKKSKRNIIFHHCIIKKLCCGTEFGIFFDQSNEMYSFGWNEHYNLLTLNNKPVNNIYNINKNIFNLNIDYKVENIKLSGAYGYIEFRRY